MASPDTKIALSGLAVLLGETAVAATHAGGVGAIVALVAGAAVYKVVGDMQAAGTGIPSLPLPSLPPRAPGQPSLAYRLFNGKSIREAEGGEAEDDLRASMAGIDDDDTVERGAFTLSALLATGWRPSYEQIFLARLADGTDIFVSVEDLVHIALAGSTRQGKTSIIRQLLAQLCYVGCRCVLLDPHYTPYDVEIDEDWTPFTPFLSLDPMSCKDYARMEQVLRYTATDVLEKRIQLRAASRPVGVPIFMVIDEYPAIIAERPEVQKYVAKLLRGGAKYKIFLCVASQDFQVKTVSPQSGGAVRENYKTCLYVGGDARTAQVLLDAPVPPEVEALLGKGPVMLRCTAVKKAALASTPFTTNQALYLLLGPSTYQPTEEDETSPAEEMAEIDAQENGRSAAPSVQQNIPAPVIPDKGRRAEEIDLVLAVDLWNKGYNSVGKLQAVFGITNHQAQRLRGFILAQANSQPEETAID